MRELSKVDDAIGALDAGDAKRAVELLTEYLSTGKCEAGAIGAPSSVIDKPNAGFDLGLGLFKLGEQFGKRFGEHEPAPEAGPSPEEQANLANRSEQVECALRIVRMVALDAALPLELRARAYYLAGNLEFLRRDYRSAVKSYDQALGLIPGLPEDAGDGTGRDAAYNRAIALQRIEEEPPPDAEPDASPDARDPMPSPTPALTRSPMPNPMPARCREDSGDSGEPDSGKDEPDSGDGGKNDEPKDQKPDAGDKEQPSTPTAAKLRQSGRAHARHARTSPDLPAARCPESRVRRTKRHGGQMRPWLCGAVFSVGVAASGRGAGAIRHAPDHRGEPAQGGARAVVSVPDHGHGRSWRSDAFESTLAPAARGPSCMDRA